MRQSKEHIMNNQSDTPSPIAGLNDALRREGRGGRIMVTAGVQAMGPVFVTLALEAVRLFNDFNPRNDPYGEHDCALIEIEGQSILWKIDYYDTALTHHSPDPANAEVTCRILTIMLADEY